MEKDWFKGLTEAVLWGKADDAVKHTQDALAAGIAAEEILERGLVSGMSEVGIRFKNNEFYSPEVLIAARAMKAAMALLEPHLGRGDSEKRLRIVIGTVRGDLHDIGKNLVQIMLRGAGFEVEDLGVDVSPEKFAQAATEKQPDLVALSALLTTTMPAMADTVKALRACGYNGKIIIGGAPITASYANEIGADLFGENAAVAVDVVRAAFAAHN
jgi:5-methyltetrahydrofolate--homocysteine methyltransferase